MFLGIEIGGTKLQLGLGRGDGVIVALWRGTVDVAAGAEGIRRQIQAAVPELLAMASLESGAIRGVGIGFGGPTDDATQTVITSHQIAGWDGFPLADWVSDFTGVPAVLCNDADVAGLAEALLGAGKGLSPIFYVTVGTGIGGGLIVDGHIYRGVGKGAAEIGHLRSINILFVEGKSTITVESVASGAAIQARATTFEREASEDFSTIRRACAGGPITVQAIVQAARELDPLAHRILDTAIDELAHALCQVIALLCPQRIVIGGGVSLIGDDLFFRPLREEVARCQFKPFAGLTDIVPAALGEAVVVHGALALARQKLGG